MTEREMLESMAAPYGFWYMASPYTNYPNGKDAAFEAAVENASLLTRAEIVVFSPIIHSHPLVRLGHHHVWEYWRDFDYAFICASKGVIVCKLPTWETSRGVQEEMTYADKLMKPVIYMQPGVVPVEFAKGVAA